MKYINEESAKLKIAEETKISKKLPVFYNPIMKFNRDISILLLSAIENSNMQIALPLAGSGVRGIRFLKELESEKIKHLYMNDYNITKLEENLKINSIDTKTKNITITGKDANLFLLEEKGFDYIDIDPFGSPMPFLNASIVRLARNGILAVTATDTAALAGTSPLACKRKYNAKPLRNEIMHETAIRILIKKIQEIGAQNQKALTPIFSYYKDHYYKIFLQCKKGRIASDEILKSHQYFLYNTKTKERCISKYNSKEGYDDYAGPLWTGKLWNTKLVEKMLEKINQEIKHLNTTKTTIDTDSTNTNTNKTEKKEMQKFLEIIHDESKIHTVGFYDLHVIVKGHHKTPPKMEDILSDKITRTHFLGWGVRSNENILDKV